MLRVLDLFSGIGGFALGLTWAGGFESAGFCESDSYCVRVLQRHWPGVPVFPDIRTLTGDAVRSACGPVDLVTGGFPCQPVSHAGRRRGADDARWLWPEMFRLVRDLRPRWVLAENVPGLRTLGADAVLTDLEATDYTCWPTVVGAWAVGAPHKRDRVWIVAHAESGGTAAIQQPRSIRGPKLCGEALANASGARLEERADERGDTMEERASVERGGSVADAKRTKRRQADSARLDTTGKHDVFSKRPESTGGLGSGSGWSTEPDVGRVAHGVPSRVDRLRGLGNAVVPQIVTLFGRWIVDFERGRGGER